MPVGVLGRLTVARGGPLRLFRVEVAQNLLDSILVRDRFIESELQFGHAPQTQPSSDVTSEEWRGPLERRRGIAARRGVAHHGVEHARQLQVRGHLDTSQGDETDPGIMDHTTTEELAELLPNLIADAIGSVSLSHYVRYSISDRVINPGSRRSISSAAPASSCSTCSVVFEMATIPRVARCHR